MRVERIIEEIEDNAAPLAATVLAQLSDLDPQETDRVIAALRRVSFERRRLVLQRLVELAEENVDLNFDPVFRRCTADEDGEVRAAAILGLWECEERSLIEPLLRLLKQDPEEDVRVAAIQLLGRFALLAELGKLLERDARKIEDALIQTIEGEEEASPEVRRRAVEAVGPIHTPRVREIIRETYESASDKPRASALYAMGRNADPEWTPYILEGMESAVSELRYEAAVAAGQLGGEALVEPLARLTEDADPDVQAAAITALSAVGGSAAARALRRLLHAPDDRLRELARDALESIAAQERPVADLLHPRGPGRQARSAVSTEAEDGEDEE